MNSFTRIAVLVALMGSGMAIAADIGRTTGVVKSIDAAKGTVVLSHEPVPALKWPAMTMPYRITSAQAAGLKPGSRVEFEFAAEGMDATITKIAVLK